MALENNVRIVCLITLVLGLLSVLLGFAAQATRTKLSDLYILTSGDGCVHDSSPAFALALVAALLILLVQIIISAFMGCGCCRRNDQQLVGVAPIPAAIAQQGNNRTAAILMFCVSWVTFAVSFYMFISGAAIEAMGANGNVDPNCYIVKPRVFATAATLALFTFSLSIGAYIVQNNLNAGNVSNTGIAMAQPQFPQSAGPQQQQFQQNFHAQEPQKPVNQGQQQSYPPPGTTPPGYGYNTQSYV